jgi:hypothetical protein
MIGENITVRHILASLLLLVMLINITSVASINILNHNTNYVTLHIRVLLANNKPLAHAMIIAKPTRYSTHEYINYTDMNGSAYLKTEYSTIYETIYLTIKYWIYGELYTGKVSVRNKNIVIRLNYMVLNNTFNIVDEYLEPIKIDYYILKYSVDNENKTVMRVINSNSKVIINGSIDHYLIIYNDETINNYYLVLGFNDTEKTIMLNNDLLRRSTLIIDLHRPKIWVKKLNSSVDIIDGFKYYELKAIVYIYDGVNTPNIKFWVDIRLKQKPRIIYKHNLLSNNTVVYNVLVKGSTSSSINTLHIYFYAVDPGGKESVIYRNITLIASSTSKITTSQTPIITTSSMKTATSALINTNTTTQYFHPPTRSEEESIRGFKLYYFLGPIISLLILIYEILHRRGSSISYQRSHA